MDLACQVIFSFRLGDEHQCKTNKPWLKRRKKNPPLVAKNKTEAYEIVKQVIEVAGLPPLESTYQLLINSKGGAL